MAPNTQRGAPLSIIQPNSNGPMMPPMLKPVVTMPNTRPAAPGGAARRTSMSRKGCIMPKMTPDRHMTSTRTGTESDEHGNRQHDQRGQPEAEAATLPWRLDLVGQDAAHQHAHRGAREVGRERNIGGCETDAMGGDEGDHREAVHGAVGERHQGEEPGQAQHGRA